MYVAALAESQVHTKPKLNLPSDCSWAWYFMQFFMQVINEVETVIMPILE